MRALTAGVAILAVACGGGSGGHDGSTIDAVPSPDAAPSQLTLALHRLAGSQAFDVTAQLDVASTSITVELATDRGSLGPTTAVDRGVTARLTPAGTGNYTITATAGALTATTTAIVLATVDDEWDQPEVVPGPVSTLGWEDGPSISPDGSILTVQYLPVSISCLLGGDPAAPACRVIGPIDAPERPNMPGAERVHPDHTYTNGCPSVGADTLTFPVPPDSLFAFQRQADGSFADPHPIYYDGIDGCVSAFGFELLDAAGHAVYAFDDPRHPDGPGARVFHATIDPTQDTVLGRFAVVGTTLELQADAGTRIGDATGTQGNPGLWYPPGGGAVLFTDDEQGDQDLSVNTAPSLTGPYAGKAIIPAPISAAGAQESQPFFDGTTLYFRRDLVVLATDWNGGPMSDAASWSAPRPILEPSSDTATGEAVVVGEPSIATVDGHRELYFVYARTVADGTLDLDIGRVRSR
jgi:hypothetical protein